MCRFVALQWARRGMRTCVYGLLSVVCVCVCGGESVMLTEEYLSK